MRAFREAEGQYRAHPSNCAVLVRIAAFDRGARNETVGVEEPAFAVACIARVVRLWAALPRVLPRGGRDLNFGRLVDGAVCVRRVFPFDFERVKEDHVELVPTVIDLRKAKQGKARRQGMLLRTHECYWQHKCWFGCAEPMPARAVTNHSRDAGESRCRCG